MESELGLSISSRDSFEALIAKLRELVGSLVKLEGDLRERVSLVHPSYRKSALNLIHYLALRRQDIRTLQEELAALGLSSLGRTEAHVMSTLNAVLVALHHLAGHKTEVQMPSDFPGFGEGKSLLAEIPRRYSVLRRRIVMYASWLRCHRRRRTTMGWCGISLPTE